jgi:short-subunit dehydrogenase
MDSRPPASSPSIDSDSSAPDLAPDHRRLAAVTGASSGIGYELAKQFAEHDFDLIIAAEDAGIVEAQQAFKALGAEVEAVRVDLSTFDGVQTFYDCKKRLDRPLDAVAMNAGVGVGGDFARETDLRAELDMINLNVVSTVHLAKLVLPEMIERGEGKILITSSVAATGPGPFFAVYAATKAFVQSFAQGIRDELKDTGVTVTALMPGPTDTNFFARADMEHTKVGEAEKDDPAVVAKEGFEAMMAGKDHVVAGSLRNKVQELSAKVMSEPLKAKVTRVQTEPHDPRHT